ncbi:uncharacterized protein ACWYII_000280 isoform 1-T2 [Salvelinus alpinus]
MVADVRIHMSDTETACTAVDQNRQRIREMSAIRAKQPMTKGKLGQKRGSHTAKGTKRYWSTIEVDAVEDSLMNFIKMGKMPGEKDGEMHCCFSPSASKQGSSMEMPES